MYGAFRALRAARPLSWPGVPRLRLVAHAQPALQEPALGLIPQGRLGGGDVRPDGVAGVDEGRDEMLVGIGAIGEQPMLQQPERVDEALALEIALQHRQGHRAVVLRQPAQVCIGRDLMQPEGEM